MRILFFCKRKYMSHDVITDRYARLYELPFQIVKLGNEIQGICLSYQGTQSGLFNHQVIAEKTLTWHGFNTRWTGSGGLLAYIGQVQQIINDFKPDILLGSSDCLHVIITAGLAKLFNKPYIIDLYDNYASFGMAKIPGILPLYHWALKQATGIACVSEPLSEYIRQRYKHPNVLTLESTIKGGDFYDQDQHAARMVLGLPTNAKIIGIAGSLNRERGVSLLYDSFLQMAEHFPDLHLALAGSTDKVSPIPIHPRIHYLGLLPHEAIVNFYNALDLAVVCMRNTEFGRYAFPQKTYEILACKTPILTAKLGALELTFKAYPQCLYEADNQNELQTKIEYLLQHPVVINIPVPTWQDQASILVSWMQNNLRTKC
jgi:teichuronic acid biosynthesis glycosyltransferase TuaC